ncbi:MAG: hypothetical protein Q3972_07385 [Corynebacterium sp.]|nr:hypothetical protein [Corynebacterium sp.]
MPGAVFISQPISESLSPEGTVPAGEVLSFVLPSQVTVAKSLLGKEHAIGAVVSYPHGLSQPLIKAAEARLAVGEGASAVAVCVDSQSVGDINRLLPGLIAALQGVDEDKGSFVAFLVRPAVQAELENLLTAAVMCGVDGLWCHEDQDLSLVEKAVDSVAQTHQRAKDLMILGPEGSDLPVS